jgi:DNA mismatch repair protein MutS
METLLPTGEFVPNDINLGGSHGRMILITGPNMAGKSTVMRQLALITIMAQMGSWVPAASARVGLVDRVFTRVGASDSITTGRSTFMVEMVETAEILRHATSDSLILLDEIGRGTATFDGLSIAWAVTEDIHNRVQARTLFATHYHELCDLTQSLPELRNAHVSVREWEESIIFLRRLMTGPMRRSYGVEVARLAGIQGSVVDRARDILEDLEQGPRPNQVRQNATSDAPPEPTQLNFFGSDDGDPRWDRIREMLGDSTPDDMTPRAALDLLYQLKLELEDS